MTPEFDEDEVNCTTCGDTGYVEAAVASWSLPIPCPDCDVADDLAWDAAEARGHR